MEDPVVVGAYREILLCSFVFTSSDSYNELFQLFSNHKTVVFSPIVFTDHTFSLFWLHMTRQFQSSNNTNIECVSTFIQIVGSDLVASYRSEEVEKEDDKC